MRKYGSLTKPSIVKEIWNVVAPHAKCAVTRHRQTIRNIPVITYIYILGDSETDIWGLSGRERLERMLRGFEPDQNGR